MLGETGFGMNPLILTTIRWTGIAACFVVVGFFWQMNTRIEAERSVWVAYQAKEAERWGALRDSIALESKRTSVNSEMRKIIIAEMKRMKVKK